MFIEPTIRDGMDHVHMLVDTIGKRPTGFAGERRAAGYLCEQLASWGLMDVRTEPFAARSWDFDTCRLESGSMQPLEGLPIEFSASTGPGGVEGELLVYEDPGDVRSEELGGKIVLVHGGMPADEVLLEGRPLAFILVTSNRRAWHLIYGPKRPLAGKLPMLTLGLDDGVELIRRGVRRLRLILQTSIEDVEGLNVVGSLAAANGTQERRLNISSHYDSVPAGGAAADNAAGVACALEVVRALAQNPPDVVVDVAIFSAEEIGLYGSEAYSQRHAQQLQRTELGIYFDGQGDFLGRHEILAMGTSSLADYAATLSRDLGYRADIHHGFTGVDTAFLSAQGAPTLWFTRGPAPAWHTREDVSADISAQALRESIHTAVQIARDVAAHPDRFEKGIPADQMRQIQDYVAAGAPVW
jgi:aminopeptidase YwaD